MYKILILSFFICASKVTYFLPSVYGGAIAHQKAPQRAFDLQKFLPVFEVSIQKGLETWGAPGVAVVIVVDGRVVYEKGFGVTSIRDPEPVTEHTVFPLASLSKPFVAALAMLLEDAKKINLDDEVTKWFPDLKIGSDAEHQNFILRDLMMHHSGLPGFSGDTVLWLGFSAGEIMHAMRYIPQQNPVRQKFGYQNILFGVLGLAMEKSTGQSLPSLMETYIIQPLQLKDTFFGMEEMRPKSWWTRTMLRIRGKYRAVAQPHDKWQGKVNQLEFSPYFYTLLGSTGVNTSAHDLGLWMQACMQQDEANPAFKIPNFKKMITPNVQEDKEDEIYFSSERIKDVSYGMGWYIHTYGGQKVITHQGGLRGIRSVITLSVDGRVGIAVISNLGGMRVSAMPEAVRNTFWDAYLQLPSVDWNTRLKSKMDNRQQQWRAKQHRMHHRIPAPSQPLSYYVGAYHHDIYGDMKIHQSEKKELMMEYRGKSIPLKHVNGNTYSFEAKALCDFFADAENPGIVEWGGARSEKADLCDIHLLYEGNSPFQRMDAK